MIKRRNILLSFSWYHPKIHEGIAAFARENNWHINSELARHSTHIPYGWDGDGIICQGLFTSVEQAEFFHSLPQPRVILSHNFEKFQNFITVSDDHEAIADLAAEHLLERNFNNFACFCPNEALIGVRVNRFRTQSERAGYPCHSLCPPKSINDWLSRRHWLIDELKKLPKPMAIFSQNDEFAAEVVEACMDGGIDVPQEVAVIGVRNDELICETVNVPLTSVDNNLFGIGYKAAEELERLKNGEDVEIRHYNVKPKGVEVRQSTDVIALPPGNENLSRALQFIQQNYANQQLTTDMIASAAAMSKRSLYNAFNEYIGRPPHKEVIRLRLAKAKRLLLSTNQSPAVISDLAGFSSLRSFYVTFKRELQMTPTAFRSNSQSF